MFKQDKMMTMIPVPWRYTHAAAILERGNWGPPVTESRTSLACLLLLGLSLTTACSTERNVTDDNKLATKDEARAVVAELMRDDWGMAHIYADTEDGGFFALGYAMGEDRLLPLLFNYRRVQGRLSEVFGSSPIASIEGLRSGREILVEDPIQSDLKMLRDRYFLHAKENFPLLPEQLRSNLESFMEGLKLYLLENPDQRPSWEPELHPALPLALYTSRLTAIDDNVCISKLSDEQDDVERAALVRAGNDPIMGSNAWVIGPSKSESGNVIYSSDSHGPIEDIGTFFYTWRMNAGDLDGFFVDLAGALSLVKGHTRNFAWAWTEGPRFTADCYEIKLEGPESTTYYVDGKANEIETSIEIIDVAGESSREEVFEYTKHNSVLSPVVKRTEHAVYIVSSSYAGREGFAHARYYEMARAKNERTFFDALSAMEIYPANLIVGGASGLVLYVRPGRVPVRPNGIDPRQILNGNTESAQWSGIHAFAEMPQIVNPEEGWVGNSNVSPDQIYEQVKLSEKQFPPYMGFETGYTNSRQRRSISLLAPAESVTFEDALTITTDVTLDGAKLWSAALRDALKIDSRDRRSDADNEAWKAFISELSAFDGNFRPESRGALYHVFWREAMREEYSSEIDRITEYVHAGFPIEDNELEMLSHAASIAFDRMESECGKSQGTFGEFHVVKSGTSVVGSSGVRIMGIEDRFGRQPIYATLWANGYQRVPGSCVRELRWGSRNPFVVEFSNPIRSYSLQAYGISDRPDSPHYADQVELIARGELKSNYFERQQLNNKVDGGLIFARNDNGGIELQDQRE